MPTASAIIETVRLRVDQTALTNAQALDLLNDAQRELQRRYPITWQATIAATASISPATGQFQTFAYPTDAKDVFAVYTVISGEHNLVEYDPDFFHTIDELNSATAATQPSRWSSYGGTGFFFPKLSTAVVIQVFYERLLPDLVLTGANILTTRLPEVLKDATTADYYDTLSETDKAQVYRAKAEQRMVHYLKQQRAQEEQQRDPIARTPGTLRRRKRTNWRGYTWF